MTRGVDYEDALRQLTDGSIAASQCLALVKPNSRVGGCTFEFSSTSFGNFWNLTMIPGSISVISAAKS